LTYYSGVRTTRTTRCCSALALFVAASIPLSALALFPIQKRWTLALNVQLSAAPAFDARNAYFALAGDQIVSYALATGAQVWATTARTQSNLAVVDGRVAWRLPFSETLAQAPVWDNGWLVLVTKQPAVLAFRATDGALIWRRELRAAAHAAPALAADRVYIPTEDGHVVALRVDTGAPVWDRRLGGPPSEILALDNRLYVGSKDNFFYCLEAIDGAVGWRFRTGADVAGLPAIDERNVYLVSLDNVLRALSRASGVQRWIRPLPLRPIGGPIKAGDTLVVSGIAGVRGYNINDGSAAGEAPVDGELATPPRLVSTANAALPLFLVVTRDIAKGASATLMGRDIDPPIQQPIAPLLNVTKPAPTLPQQP
jgi:outer membrane protein assembly factor BamB